MTTQITDQALHLLIDGRLYNENLLYKCFYWYTGDFIVDINLEKDMYYSVSLQPMAKQEEYHNWTETIEKIKRDLIDFRLRDIVSQETQTIKELIVAKAFAYYDTQESIAPDVSDPVGFNPENI